MRDAIDVAEGRIQDILAEAKDLDGLAQNPSTAARTRLYARVATWIADHTDPQPQRRDDTCVVCGGKPNDGFARYFICQSPFSLRQIAPGQSQIAREKLQL
jgi:hypothetical protein